MTSSNWSYSKTDRGYEVSDSNNGRRYLVDVLSEKEYNILVWFDELGRSHNYIYRSLKIPKYIISSIFKDIEKKS